MMTTRIAAAAAAICVIIILIAAALLTAADDEPFDDVCDTKPEPEFASLCNAWAALQSRVTGTPSKCRGGAAETAETRLYTFYNKEVVPYVAHQRSIVKKLIQINKRGNKKNAEVKNRLKNLAK